MDGWISPPAIAIAMRWRRSPKERLAEQEVARRAVDLARAAARSEGAAAGTDRAGHVGFYLIDKGAGTRAGRGGEAFAPRRLAARAARYPLLFYLGPIALMTGAMSAGLS